MGYTLSQAKAFIEEIAPMIVSEGTKRGYKIFSTTISQAIVEGACGTSRLAQDPYNNHFGMKCGTKWTGRSVNMKTMEDYGAGLVAIKDNFRCYDSMLDCVKGYYDFLSATRYSNLKEAADYKQFAEFLKKDGYATAQNYIDTLCKTVEKYSLQKYDLNTEQVPISIQKRRTIRRGMSGSDVILIQKILVSQGYNIGKYGVDGRYGPDCEKAIRTFQSERDMVVDGIVGPKTWMMLEKYN